MNKTMAKEKAEVESTVQELNKITSLCGIPTTSVEEVMSGHWSLGTNDGISSSSAAQVGK